MVSSPTDLSVTEQRPALTEEDANRAFSISVVVSGIRCLLTYILFPWVIPALGWANDVGPSIGLVVGTIAIFFNVASIRRFWLSDHRLKWPITMLSSGVIVLLSVLIVLDLSELIG